MLEDVSLSVTSDSGLPLRLAAWRLQGLAAADAPRVYLQAGLHADEIAGMLVLHLLLARLQQAQADGRLLGTVTLVPQANPFGVGQFRWGRLHGRFHEASGQNFNRHFDQSLALTRATGNFAQWQQALVGLAADADLVLDLHTDEEALPYLYVHRHFWPQGKDLAAALGADVAIIWDEGGDGSFEEAITTPWLKGDSCGKFAATLELRGQDDVSDDLAEQDAQALYAWLCERGVVDAPVELDDWQGQAVEIGHMESVFSPVPGVFILERALGSYLQEGERFARILQRPGDPGSEIILRAPQAGRLITHYRDRLVPQGAVVAKLTGTRLSENWGGGSLDT